MSRAFSGKWFVQAALMLWLANDLSAQSIYHYNGNTSGMWDTKDANLVATNLTLGSGLSMNSACTTQGFHAEGWPTVTYVNDGTSIDNSNTDGDYIEFQLTPAPGYRLTVTGFTTATRRTGANGANRGPREIAYSYSTDGGTTFFPYSGPFTPQPSGTCGDTGTDNAWPLFSTVSATSTIIFRIYGYDAGTNGVGDLFIEEIDVTGQLCPGLELTANGPDEAECGETVTIDIEADGFCGLSSLQYSVNWDPTEFEYLSHLVTPIDGSTDFVIVDVDAANGVLQYLWSDGNIPCGADLPNGTDLISINFTAIGCNVQDVEVNITNNPLPVEAGECSFVLPLAVTLHNNVSVDIDDTTPPVWTTMPGFLDRTVECDDAPGLADAQDLIPEAADACDQMLPAPTKAPGLFVPGNDCPQAGTYTNTWTVTDDCGNTATYTQVITIVDTTPPTANCADDFTVSLDETGNATITVGQVNNVSIDNCASGDDLLLSVNPSAFTCSDLLAPVVVTLTVDDQCNISTCTTSVTILDPVSPVITGCPDDISVDNDMGVCSAIVTWTPPVATDNCDLTVSVDASHQPGDEFPVGTTTVTYTFTDDADNAEVCSFDVIVSDAEAPVITGCPDDIPVDNDMGECSALVSWMPPTAMDNCDITVSVDASHQPGDEFPVGTTTVTYVFTDDSDNSAECSFDVIVTDAEAPEVTGCPDDIPVNNDMNFCSAIVTWTPPVATDNCDVTVMEGSNHQPGDEFPIGTTTVTYTFTDNSDNSTNCSFDVIVTDDEDPMITCPNDINTTTDPEFCSSPVEFQAVATDNCTAVVTYSQNPGTDFPAGITLVTATATDPSMNTASCQFTVTVTDDEAPAITCPDDITVETDPDACNAVVTFEADATDNCGDVTVDYSQASGTMFSTGATMVTVTATDAADNTSTCAFTVTVNDTEIPVALCHNFMVDLDENGLATILAGDIDNGSDDNCAFTLSLSQSTFTCDDVDVPGPEVLAYSGAITEGNQTWDQLLGMVFTVNTPVEITALGAFDDDQDGLLLPIQVGIVRNSDGMVMAGPVTLSGITDPLDAAHRVQTIPPVALPAGQYTIVALGYGATEQNGNSSISGSGTTLNTGGGLLVFNSASFGGNTFGLPTTPWPTPNVFHAGTFKFRQANVGATVTLTVTDNSSNTATCTATVFVEDNTPPEVICFPEIPVYLDENGEASIIAEDLIDNATDNCDIDSYLVDSFIDIFFDCDDIGENTLTVTVTDVNGNTATCTSTVIVEDEVAPVAECQDITVELDNDGIVAIAANQIDNGSSDFCGDVTLSLDPTQFDCDNIGENTVTLTVTDESGNTATCEATVTVADITPPTITFCPEDLIMECVDNADYLGQINTWIATAVAEDACDNMPEFSTNWNQMDLPALSCDLSQGLTITFTAADGSANTATCVRMVYLDDTQDPAITCPAPITINCQDSQLPANTGAATATDLCDTDPVIASTDMIVPGNCPDTYTIERTWFATDDCTNSATCLQIISVQDITAPAITCPANTNVNCEVPAIPANTGTATATDNCDTEISITSEDITTSGNCPDNRTISRTWTATDNCDNSTSCVQIINIKDISAPVLVCPANTTVSCDVDPVPGITGTATATDNCDMSVLITYDDAVAPGSCPQASIITRTWLASDDCLNATACIQTINVLDVTPPVITCPDIATVECPASTDPNMNLNLVKATATDNCAPALSIQITYQDITTPGLCSLEYTITRTWTATDPCNNSANCTQTISVEDNTAPAITCPDNKTVECTESTAPANTGSPITLDLCDPSLSTSFADIVTPSLVCTQERTITRTWITSDDCGNANACTQTIFVDDSTPPSWTTATLFLDRTVECSDATGLSAAQSLFPVATDNCDNDVTDIVKTAGVFVAGTFCPQEGTYTNTWAVTDACGNLSAVYTQVITITDNTAPVATAPTAIDIECSTGIPAAATSIAEFLALPGATAGDLCSPTAELAVSSSTSVLSGDQCSGTFSRTYTISDQCGNSISVTQNITVTDNTLPVIVCPNPVTINCQDSQLPANTGMATATDNCTASPEITFEDVEVPGACPGNYTVERTWTAKDGCGNTATCLQLITVQDVTPPAITCPAPITINCQDSQLPANTGAATATDLCDTDPVISSTDVIVPGNCPDTYTIERTWLATDNCTNSTTCLQIIQVQDITAPVIDCPDNMIINCEVPATPANTGTATATDNCDTEVSITSEDVTTPGNCPDNRTISRTWTATDNCDNSSSCVQIIEIQDVTVPILTLPADITVNCNESTLPANTGAATATDNCDTAPVVDYVDDTTDGDCPQEMIITRRWIAVDNCLNATATIQIITVQDNVPPAITCPAGLTVDCDDDKSPTATGTATALDNCDTNPDITFGDLNTPGECPQEYTITRTWTAEDACGNSTNCQQTINVQDVTKPVITCPANITVECNESTDPADTGEATATDNCDPDPAITSTDESTVGDCEYTITRTWIAIDACLNLMACTQTIVVRDSEGPVVSCQAVTTVECDESTDPSNTGMATATDNCGMATVPTHSDVVVAGTCPQESVITRTWTSTDDCNNIGTCVQTITVDDSTPPVITCPANITVQCDESLDPSENEPLGKATADDNCDMAPEISYDDVTAIGSCAQGSGITRTWTATDACGNPSSCDQTITVIDDVAPEITCPAGVTVECTESLDPAMNLNLGEATADDNCDPDPTIDYADETGAGSCPQGSVVTRTWTATDACDNAMTCVQTITVEDTTSPVITCPADATVECDEDSSPAALDAATATDACDTAPVVTFEDLEVMGQCPQASVITRTWTAEDGCGNSTTCVQIITVEDTTAPTLACPPGTTVECDETAPDFAGTPTVDDNCDDTPDVTFSDATAPGNCPESYTITRTWTAVDACNNSATPCVQTIAVEDNTAPAINCPDDITINCEDDDTPANTGMATAIDNCDPDPGINAVDTDVDGNCANEKIITRRWVAVDNCANISVCIQTITVQDNEAPGLDCPADVTVECDDDNTPAGTGEPVVTDNCDSAPTVTFDDQIAQGSCQHQYTITRTWTVSDVCGNMNTCVQTIAVQDVTPPVIDCPTMVTVECDESTDPDENPALGQPDVQDNCDNAPIVTHFDGPGTPGDCPQERSFIRTWAALDNCNNAAACLQQIFIVDSEGPVVSCLAVTTVECDESTDPSNTGMATATDNCGMATVPTHSDVVVAGTCPQESVITRTWTSTDDCNNIGTCVQTITVDDSTPPVITCPANITVQCDESLDPSENEPLGKATADDNCDMAPEISYDDVTAIGSCAQGSGITRTWTATDACGNPSSCDQTITVIDDVAPEITCPAGVTVECTESLDPAMNLNLGEATADDNCDPDPTIDYADETGAGSCPQGSVVTRTWTATDACDNAVTCVQTITVEDTTPPVITCPADATVECDEDNSPAALDAATATDACDTAPVVTFEDLEVMGQCPQASVITRTWTAEDGCGNSTTCVQIITVEDTTAPTLACPPGTTVECDETAPDFAGTPTVDDNCDDTPDVAFSDATAPGGCVDEYTITRTWTATDGCNNSATPCVQTIAVQDNTAPVISCPDDITINCEDDDTPANTGMATAIDNCDPDPTVAFGDETMQGTCAAERIITREWFSFDHCGNVIACNQLISIVDDAPPVISCPGNVTVECSDDLTPAGTGMAGAQDICDPAPVITSADETSPFGDCPQEYLITRTWTATDACGNSTACIQTIQVEDNTAPEFVCPANITIECDESADPLINPAVGVPTVDDNCDSDPVVTYLDSNVPGQCSLDVVITRTWLVADACDNPNLCTQIISVEDNTGPLVDCPANITIECTESADPEINDNLGFATADDNCGTASIPVFTDNSAPLNCPQEKIITRTWTSVDDCGNIGTCEQSIFIDDSTLPAIVCPDDVTVECDESLDPEVNLDLGSATATDNCDNEPAVTYDDDETPGTCPQERSITRTWGAVDDCGNFSLCDQTITVEDTTPPALSCPADVTVECDQSTDPLVNTAVGQATATDNCDQEPIDISYTDATGTGGCAQGSVITRSWTATDACGNSTNCVQTITVDDNTPPAITCPDDATVDCDADYSPDALGFAGATDLCDPQPAVTFEDTEVPGQCPQEPVITRTWTAVDACGNTNFCSQIILLRDDTPPTLVCPANTTVECDDTTPEIAGTPTVTDNCDLEPIADFSDVVTQGNCPDARTIARTWTAIDHCGNSTAPCTQIIAVEDTTPPMLTCPDDVTVECDEDYSTTAAGVATAVDNCDAVASVTFLDFEVPGDCPQEVTIQRRWFAVDNCNNAAACTQIIVVQDNTVPELTCPQDVTIQCDQSLDPGPNAPTGMALADDNCDDQPTVTFVDVVTPGSCQQASVIERTWTATDACGNATTCTQTITVIDNTAPVITCPPAITLDCGVSTDPDINLDLETATAADNCDPTPDVTYIDVADVPGQCPQERFITRSWLASDDCNNAVACSQLIHVIDNTPPAISCPADQTVECGNSTDPLVNTPLGFASAVDNCGTASVPVYTDAVADGQCAQEQVITRTWTSVDECGNMTSCQQTIFVDDSTPPGVTCPADLTVNCGDELDPFMNTALGVASATDNCDLQPVVDYNDELVAGTCPTGVIVQRTWTATDACGNNATTCLQQIALTDNDPPTITCPAAITINCQDNTDPYVNTALGIAVAQDDCSLLNPITYEDTNLPGICPIVGQIVRVWRAEDGCDNSTICIQFIFQEDTTPPAVTCPLDDLTVECGDPEIDLLIADWLETATATDDCGAASLSNNFDVDNFSDGCGLTGTQTVTFSATDNCQNSSTANCSRTISIEDTTPPTVVCPPNNLTLECGDPENGALINGWLATASAEDACGTATAANNFSTDNFSDGCGATGIQTVTFSATDECQNSSTANCLRTITIVDNTAPVLNCPLNDLTLECNDQNNATLIDAWLASATATDACGTATVSNSYATGNFSDGCGATGAQTVSFSATDECQNSNTASCSKTIIILDTTPPTINGDCDLIDSYGNGTNAASYIVGTSAGSVCPGDAMVNLTVDQVISDDYEITVGGVAIPGILGCLADNCSSTENLTARVVEIIEEGDGCIKEFEIRMVVLDECANQSVDTISYFVEVADNTPPTIACPLNDLTLECGNPDNPGLITAWLNSATATDNCNSATANNNFSVDNFSDGCGATGAQTVTFRATDACQNSSTNTCSRTVTILDNTPPTVTCPPNDLTVECSPNPPDDIIAAWVATALAEDNCGTAELGASFGGFDQGCGTTGTITVTFFATDECQNSSTANCTRTISNVDTTPPAITCPDDITIDCSESADPIENQSLGMAAATDACDLQLPAPTFTDENASGDCPELLRITRTWQAVDACENGTTCVQVISVHDTEAPTFTAPPDITLELDADCSVSLANTGDVTDEDDNCSGNIEAVSSDATEPGPGDSEYTITRTWTLTDDCGNATTHTQVITVVDNMLPLIECPDDLSVSPNGPECSYTVEDGSLDPNTSDNCGVRDISYALTGATTETGTGSLDDVPFNEGQTVVSWTVTDVNGNSTGCSFTVNVASCLQISGTLIWEGDDTDMTGVAQAFVDLTGDASDTDGPTPASGNYTLVADSGTNFAVKPGKNAPPADPMNGVTTLDALLVQQYIVGAYTFADAYKMIAADVNNSNAITTLDASIIRQAILGSPGALAWFQNRPWRFVPTPANTPYSLGYTPPANPFSAPIPSNRVLTGVVADAVAEDFYGIKIGDVNATGDPLLHPVNDEPLIWQVQDQRLEAGKELLVVFRASQFNNLGAYQFALRFDTAQLQLLGVEPLSDALKLSANGNFGLHNVANGEIRHVWIDPYGKTLPEGEQAFALRFSARESGAWLHEVLGLKPKVLAPEAYTVEHATGDLQLVFTEPQVSTGVDQTDPAAPGPLLFQNSPNPFSEQTRIGFFLPKGCDAQLRVLDITGRELFRIDGTYSAGYHEETIYLRDIGTGGMLWYELTTPQGKQARKMVAAGP